MKVPGSCVFCNVFGAREKAKIEDSVPASAWIQVAVPEHTCMLKRLGGLWEAL